MPKYSRIVHFGSDHGVDALLAGSVAEVASASGRNVMISVDGHAPVDAANILSLRSVALAKGDDVTVSVIAENRDTGIRILGEVAALIATEQKASPALVSLFSGPKSESHA